MDGFPEVIEIIDCANLPSGAPADNEEIYGNRKHFHIVSIQLVCNARNILTAVPAEYPGVSSDTCIFHMSKLIQILELRLMNLAKVYINLRIRICCRYCHRESGISEQNRIWTYKEWAESSYRDQFIKFVHVHTNPVPIIRTGNRYLE